MRDKPIDWEIENWQQRKRLASMEITPFTRYDLSEDKLTLICVLTYVIVYSFEAGARQSTMARPGYKPLWARGTPRVPVEDLETGRRLMAMAGMFPVEEGARFHKDDTRPAPIVLLSPDFEILRYTDLFEMEPPHEPGRTDDADTSQFKVGHGFPIPLPPDA